MNKRLSQQFRRLAARSLSALLAVGGLGATSVSASAIDLPGLLGMDSQPQEKPTTGYPPPPLSVFGDSMPEPGHVTLSVIPQFGENGHMLMGTQNITTQQVVSTFPGWYWDPAVAYNTIPQAQFLEAQSVTLAYGVMKDLSLVLLTGTQEKHSHLVTMYGSSFPLATLITRGTSFPGTDSLLDTQAAFIWRAYEDNINRVKVNLGMSFPTGSNHNMGGAVLNTAGGYGFTYSGAGNQVIQAFYGMQTGTNTFDLMPGILYAGVIDPWTWGLSYRARLPLTTNPEGYKWGNYQDASGWIGYTWFKGFTTFFRLNYNIQSQISGADPWTFGKLPSANPLNWGGKMIQVFGGADIDGKLIGAPGWSIGIEAGVPVYQNLNGPQLSRIWQAGMALRWRVGEEEKEEKVSKTGIFKGPAPEPAKPRMPWDGVYAGVTTGYTFAANTSTNFTYAGSLGSSGFASLYAHGSLPAEVDLDSQGVIAGAQVGYNRQLWERYVVGFEADLSGMGVGNSSKGSWQGTVPAYLQAGRNQHFFGTVRGRVGYLATPEVLVYGTGGLAFGENDLNATYFAPTLKPALYLGGSQYGQVDMFTGWTAGAGVEWLLNPAWSLKAEYLYYDLGTVNVANIGPLWYTTTGARPTWSNAGYRADFSGNVFRVGVNYHFGKETADPVVPGAPLFAGGLPSVKGAPLPAPLPPLWNGLYAGLNAGARIAGDDAVSHTTYATGPGFDAGTVLAGTYPVRFYNGAGFIGGAQAGYNYQLALGKGMKDLVLGLETDIQGLTVSDSQYVSNLGLSYLNRGGHVFTGGNYSRSIDYLGTLRGRIGLVLKPTVLAYVTGGLAYGGVSFSGQGVGDIMTATGALAGVGFGGSSLSDTKAGYALGGGVEWMFLPNWSVKAEYLYYNLGTYTTNSPRLDVRLATGATVSNNANIDSITFDGHVLRAGVNYHFNWAAPAPVLAKY
jgi:opacity protein-like surface antigen